MIVSVTYMYIIKFSVPSLFTLYKRKGPGLNCLNTNLRVIFSMHYLEKIDMHVQGCRYTLLVPIYFCA